MTICLSMSLPTLVSYAVTDRFDHARLGQDNICDCAGETAMGLRLRVKGETQVAGRFMEFQKAVAWRHPFVPSAPFRELRLGRASGSYPIRMRARPVR